MQLAIFVFKAKITKLFCDCICKVLCHGQFGCCAKIAGKRKNHPLPSRLFPATIATQLPIIAPQISIQEGGERKMALTTRPYLNGIGYVPYYSKDLVPVEEAAERIERLNAKSVRLWHPFATLMDAPDRLRSEVVDFFHGVYSTLRKHGVEQIIALNHDWFLPDETGRPHFAGFAVPHRDTKAFAPFLQWYETMWRAQAREFPEVDGWETGNEMNHVPFLHASDAKEHGDFTLLDRADLCTEMMLCSARGIRSSAPQSLIVMPGMAPIGGERIGVFANNVAVEYDGMVQTLRRIYENIASGKFGSTNPRDYFDALCWHPYYAVQNDQGDWRYVCPDDAWVRLNNSVYAVAEEYGDAGIGCYLSEYGFNDNGDAQADAQLAEYLAAGIRLAKEKMPYVQSIQVYRLLNIMDVPGVIDDYSLFDWKGGKLLAKKKAYAVQACFGGSGSLD